MAPRHLRDNAPMTATTARRPARHRPATVAPVPAPELMDETHREIEQVLGRMERLAQMLAVPAQAAQAAVLAEQACRFFNGPARAHHEAEETQVFPRLLADHDAAVRTQVQRLQQDHNWIEEDWLELEPQLQAVARGQRAGDVDFLRAALAEFTALYREHLAVEEVLLHR